MSSEPIRDLPAWAEDYFSSLCSKAGVTRNKSLQDRTGWDYLIEFPARRIQRLPADLQPIERSARVQVKSKESGKPTASIKLSNAIRFAKDPTPCFVVLIAATHGSNPVRIFAKHFWEKEIADTLKRARQAEDTVDLHKKSLTIRFLSTDNHTSDLIAWMERTLVEIGERYAEIKDRLEKSIGFENGSIHGSITFEERDLETLIDHSIGLDVKAPPMNVTLKQRRFGIDAVVPIVSGAPDIVNIRSHPIPCRVRVSGKAHGELWLDAELFVPALPGLPRELRKLRVLSGFLEIVLSGLGAGAITLDIKNHERMSLVTLRKMTTLRLLTAQGALEFQLYLKGRLELAGDAIVAYTEQPWISDVPEAISCLEKAIAGVTPDDFKISFADLLESWRELIDFSGLVTGTNLKIKCVVDPPLAQAPEGTVFLVHDYLNIAGWTILAVVERPILSVKVDGAVFELACGDPSVVEAQVCRGDGLDFLDQISEMRKRAKFRDGTIELFDGSYRALVTHSAQPSDSDCSM